MKYFVESLMGGKGGRTYLQLSSFLASFLALALQKKLIEAKDKGVDYNWKGYKN